MQTTPQLEVQGAGISGQKRDLIRSQLRKLESRFGKIVACRVVIRPPGPRHRMGAPYAVSLHLTLPGGREVNVGLVSRNLDLRYEDLSFALHDTFRKAIRQLQRQVSRLRGNVRNGKGARRSGARQ